MSLLRNCFANFSLWLKIWLFIFSRLLQLLKRRPEKKKKKKMNETENAGDVSTVAVKEIM